MTNITVYLAKAGGKTGNLSDYRRSAHLIPRFLAVFKRHGMIFTLLIYGHINIALSQITGV